jgi:hypothetical protein
MLVDTLRTLVKPTGDARDRALLCLGFAVAAGAPNSLR